MFEKLLDNLRKRRRDEAGQTMSEYAVVLAVISSTTVALFTLGLSNGIASAVTSVAGLLP